MARKTRLEYPGAIYHVLNRGNYRGFVFETPGARSAFRETLYAACARYRWRLYAYVVMGNHYHLAVETAEPNLSAGMHWLQAVFALNFNKFRRAHGHLFQGRYKALLVEPGEALGMLCHYIHLNPVRAGMVTVASLRSYKDSSYPLLWAPRDRPEFLDLRPALVEAGHLSDTADGWASYTDFLVWQAAEGPAGKNQAAVNMSRGWALGTKEFKSGLLQEYADLQTRAFDQQSNAEIRGLVAEESLARALALIRPKDKISTRLNAAWKVAIATHLRQTTAVSNPWLASRLAMGSGRYVAKQVSLARRHPGAAVQKLLHLLQKV